MTDKADFSSFPLSLLESGEEAKIVEIKGGRGIREKLNHLGLFIGDEISILQNMGVGNIIVKKGDLRLGIGMQMSFRIMVIKKDTCEKRGCKKCC